MVITQQQLKERMSGVGSSDMAAILGLDKYRSPYHVWLEKTGRAAPDDAGEKARIGTIIEPSILRLVEEEIGQPVVPVHETMVSGILRANLDGMVGAAKYGSTIVEAKSSGISEGWGEAGSDEIPDRVMVQVHHQMVCAGSHDALVGALIADRGLSFALYRIGFNKDLAELIVSEANRFWNMVELDRPPEATVPSAIDLPILARIERSAGEIISIPPSVVEDERRMKEVYEAAKTDYDDAKARLLAAMGTAEAAVADGGWSITYRNVETNRFDAGAFHEAHPELSAQFIKQSSYRRLSVRRKKS